MSGRITFSKADRMNPLWPKVMDYFEHRLDELRVINDRDQDERKTSEIRGRIAEVKATLALNNDEPALD